MLTRRGPATAVNRDVAVEELDKGRDLKLHTPTDSGGQEGAAGDRGDLLPRDAGEEGALRKGLASGIERAEQCGKIKNDLPKP